MVNKFSGAPPKSFATREEVEVWMAHEYGGHIPQGMCGVEEHRQNMTFEGFDDLGHGVY